MDRIIRLLQEHFNPNSVESIYSLSLNGNNISSTSYKSPLSSSYMSNLYGYSNRYFGGGAKLSHDHKTQYYFVLQSFTLWKEIMYNLTRLWICSDDDMLHEPYRLSDTGQGYHRMQSCPKVGNEMSRILHKVKSSIKQNWIGLSVVHLGDRDVPNCKYTD